MKIKIMTIAFISLMLSCNKESNNPLPIAKGKVIDAVTKQPLANVYIALYKTEGDFFNPKYVLVGEQLTDSQGNFNFNRTDAILIRAKKETYFDSKEYDMQDDVYKQNQTIELVPEAFVNVRLVNKEKKWTDVIIYAYQANSIFASIAQPAYLEIDTTFYGLKCEANSKGLGYQLNRLLSNPSKV
jgi:5-hydroxyisourate hydrolase-like protein (transthyretin family)